MNTVETQCLKAMEDVLEDLTQIVHHLSDVRDESIYAHERHYVKLSIKLLEQTMSELYDNMDLMKIEHNRKRQKKLELQ